MVIFNRELKANYRNFFIWTIALSILVYSIMYIFPTIAMDGASFQELIESMPESFIAAFNLNRLSLHDIFGFYATEAYLFHSLFGSIFAILLGSSLLSKEEDEKTIEFLLAKPVTRAQIVTEKMLTYVVFITAYSLILFVVSFAAFEQFKIDEYNLTILILLSLAAYLVHLTFANFGFLMAMFITRKKSIYPTAIGLILAMYFLNILSSLQDNLAFLGYLSPFRYADAADIIIDEQLKVIYIIILLTVNILLIAASYLLYKRRDITV